MTREELEQKLDWALGEIEAVKPAFDLAIKTAQRAELEITRLQEALAAAEARIAAAYVSLTNCPHDMGYDLECGPIGCRLDLTAEGGCVCSGIGPALAPLTSVPLPALLAETRKKALEEALEACKEVARLQQDYHGDVNTGGADACVAALLALQENSNER